MKTTISKGNKKLGEIPNISLPPVWSCVKGIPCAKGCYAMKAYRMYPNVKTAWNNNLAMAKTNRIKYFSDIYGYILNKKPANFRWHVAGDILDLDYFEYMIDLAYMFPNTNFLVFTKNYKVINDFITENRKMPKNLNVIFSAWPGWIINNPHNLPVAFCQDKNKTEDRIPRGTKKCPGSCSDCKTCFTRKQNVYFMIH